jgi:hypothetical protein
VPAVLGAPEVLIVPVGWWSGTFSAAPAAAVAHQPEYVRHGPIWQSAGSASHRAWTARPETTKTAR